MSGYYPDGVTGREYAIAGPDKEYEDTRTVYCENEECNAFEIRVDAEVSLESYRDEEWGLWECAVCAQQFEYRGSLPEDDFWDNYGE